MVEKGLKIELKDYKHLQGLKISFGMNDFSALGLSKDWLDKDILNEFRSQIKAWTNVRFWPGHGLMGNTDQIQTSRGVTFINVAKDDPPCMWCYTCHSKYGPSSIY